MDFRKCVLRSVLVGIIAVLCVAGVQAEESLNGDVIRRFVESLVALQPLQEKYRDAEWASGSIGKDGAQAKEGMTPMTDSLEAMKGHEAYDELASVVESHGFASPKTWGRVGDRIIKAYAAASMEAEQPGSRQQMQQALKELENADLPEAQKQMMRQSMGNAMATIKSLTDAPQADIDAVQPYMAEIERAFVQDPVED